MDRNSAYSKLYWGILFLGISMDFTLFVSGISIKIIGLVMMYKGAQYLAETTKVPEFFNVVNGCKAGVVFWVLMIILKTAIVQMGLGQLALLHIVLYCVGWAAVQIFIIRNIFNGVQAYIKKDILQKYTNIVCIMIVLIAAMGCLTVFGIAMISAIRLVAEVALVMWVVKLMGKLQYDFTRR